MIIKLYNGEVEIDFKEVQHSYWYKLDTGKKLRLAGVTKYISLLDKPALIRWAVNCAIDHIKENMNDSQNPLALVEEARYKHDEIKKDSARKGNEIHGWIETYIKTKEREMPPSEDTTMAIIGLYEWILNEKILDSEKIVFSKKHLFVGTLDLIIEREGKKWLVDIKTGNGNKIYPEMVLQLSAYKGAYEEELGKIEGCMILQVNKETGEVTEHIVECEKEDYKTFLDIKKVYEWKKATEKKLK